MNHNEVTPREAVEAGIATVRASGGKLDDKEGMELLERVAQGEITSEEGLELYKKQFMEKMKKRTVGLQTPLPAHGYPRAPIER